MAAEKRFNVYIKKNSTGEIVATIGTNLTERQAEKREMTGLTRIDTNNYFVDVVAV